MWNQSNTWKSCSCVWARTKIEASYGRATQRWNTARSVARHGHRVPSLSWSAQFTSKLCVSTASADWPKPLYTCCTKTFSGDEPRPIPNATEARHTCVQCMQKKLSCCSFQHAGRMQPAMLLQTCAECTGSCFGRSSSCPECWHFGTGLRYSLTKVLVE